MQASAKSFAHQLYRQIGTSSSSSSSSPLSSSSSSALPTLKRPRSFSSPQFGCVHFFTLPPPHSHRRHHNFIIIITATAAKSVFLILCELIFPSLKFFVIRVQQSQLFPYSLIHPNTFSSVLSTLLLSLVSALSSSLVVVNSTLLGNQTDSQSASVCVSWQRLYDAVVYSSHGGAHGLYG